MGMDGFPSQLFKTNAILDLLTGAKIGLSLASYPYNSSEIKELVSQAADLGKFLGPEQHERGGDVLDNEPVDPSGPLESPLFAAH